ncbi:hypothetical protein F5Y14DRAFT_319301 [Nemania sp. NC0429]|nr:hypothetical protein F5Y14DRAFT_319301 [Nemania sp. NC0429]
MQDIISQHESLAASPPTDAIEKQRLYNACRKLSATTEDHLGTASRVNGSVLIIDEMIIPNVGANPRSTMQDLTMMAALASAERTERQWDELLERAGLLILDKLCYSKTTGESAIVTVPKQLG